MCDKKTKCPFGVIETATGKTLWTKKAKQIKFTKHSVLDTKEIQISNNNKYLAVGAHVELTWIEGEGHGFYEGNDRAIKMAAEFFLKQFSTGE